SPRCQCPAPDTRTRSAPTASGRGSRSTTPASPDRIPGLRALAPDASPTVADAAPPVSTDRRPCVLCRRAARTARVAPADRAARPLLERTRRPSPTSVGTQARSRSPTALRLLPDRCQNTILLSQSSIPQDTNDVASRIAHETLARRGVDYTSEVRRLLDA